MSIYSILCNKCYNRFCNLNIKPDIQTLKIFLMEDMILYNRLATVCLYDYLSLFVPSAHYGTFSDDCLF